MKCPSGMHGLGGVVGLDFIVEPALHRAGNYRVGY